MTSLACGIFGANCPEPPENRVNIVNKTVAEVIIRNISECQSDLNTSNIVSMKCNPSEEMMRIKNQSPNCLATRFILEEAVRQNKSPEVIGKLGDISAKNCAACVQDNITQNLVMKFKQACEIKNENVTQIQQQIKNALEQIAQKEVKGTGAWIQQPDASNIVNSVNESSNSVTKENINRMISKLAASNVVEMDSSGGGFQNGITQDTSVDIVVSMLAQNSNYTTAVANFENALKQFMDKKSSGVATGLADSFAGIFSGGIGIMIVVLVLVVILGGLGVLAYTMMQSDSGSSSSYNTGSYGAGYGQFGQGMAGIGEFSDGSSAGDYSLMSNIANYLAGLGQGKMNGWF